MASQFTLKLNQRLQESTEERSLKVEDQTALLNIIAKYVTNPQDLSVNQDVIKLSPDARKAMNTQFRAAIILDILDDAIEAWKAYPNSSAQRSELETNMAKIFEQAKINEQLILIKAKEFASCLEMFLKHKTQIVIALIPLQLKQEPQRANSMTPFFSPDENSPTHSSKAHIPPTNISINTKKQK